MAIDSAESERQPSAYEELGGGVGVPFPEWQTLGMRVADPAELEPVPRPGWELDPASGLSPIAQIREKFASIGPWCSPQDAARQNPPGSPQAAE